MIVVFSPIFVADTKIIFRYDFEAPLKGILLKGCCKLSTDYLFQKQPPVEFYKKAVLKNFAIFKKK